MRERTRCFRSAPICRARALSAARFRYFLGAGAGVLRYACAARDNRKPANDARACIPSPRAPALVPSRVDPHALRLQEDEMSIGFIFWLLMLLSLIFGVWFFAQRQTGPMRVTAGFIWILLFLLGVQVFGWPIK